MIREVLRYAGTGIAGLICNLSLLVIFVDGLGISSLPAAVASTLVTLSITFSLTDRWVFEQSDKRLILPYYAVMVSAKGLNIAIYSVLLGYIWYPLAWIIGSGLVFFFTFVINRFLWSLPQAEYE